MVRLIDVVRNPHTKTPCLIFEFINNSPYKQLYANFSDLDCRFYMFELLRALDYAHSNGIMHRDVKPQVPPRLPPLIFFFCKLYKSLCLFTERTERDDRSSETPTAPH